MQPKVTLRFEDSYQFVCEGCDWEALSVALAKKGWRVGSRGHALVARRGLPIAVLPFVSPLTPLLVTLRPNESGIRVSVWAATNVSTPGFWKRVSEELEDAVREWATVTKVTRLTTSLAPTREAVWYFAAEMPGVVFLAFLCALLLSTLIVAVGITGAGMAPTLPAGSRVVAYRGPQAQRLARVGDIVILGEAGSRQVRRLVAVGPASVRLENGRVIVGGKLTVEAYASGGNGKSAHYDLGPGDDLAMLDSRSSAEPLQLLDSDITAVALLGFDRRGVSVLWGP